MSVCFPQPSFAAHQVSDHLATLSSRLAQSYLHHLFQYLMVPIRTLFEIREGVVVRYLFHRDLL